MAEEITGPQGIGFDSRTGRCIGDPHQFHTLSMCNDGSITTIKYPLPTGSLLISQLLSRGCPTSNLLSPPPLRWCNCFHCAGVPAGIALAAFPSTRCHHCSRRAGFCPIAILIVARCLFEAGIAEGSVSSIPNPRRNNPWVLERCVRPLPLNPVRNRTHRRRGCLGPRSSCPNCC